MLDRQSLTVSPGIENFDHEALLSVIDAIVIIFVGCVAVGTRGGSIRRAPYFLG